MKFYLSIKKIINGWPTWFKASLVGLMLTSGFLNFYASYLSILGLVGYFLLIKDIKSLKSLVKISWLVWYLLSLGVFLFFWSIYPLTWLDSIPNYVQILIIAFCWLTASLWLSVTGIFFAVGFYWWQKFNQQLGEWRYLILALWFLITEQLGSLVYSIMTTGPDTKVNFYFGLGKIGNVTTNLPGLVSLVKFGGPYFLSFLTAAIIIFIIFGRWKNSRTRTAVSLLILILVIAFNYPSLTRHKSEVTVVVIDTNFIDAPGETESAWTQKQTSLESAVKSALTHQPNYIILPEDAGFNISTHLRFLLEGSKTVLINSKTEVAETGDMVLRARAIGNGVSESAKVDKQYFVPLGEYVPYFYAGVLRLLGFGETLTKLQTKQSYRPGPIQSLATDDMPAVLFCSEVLNPLGVAISRQNKSTPFVAYLVSHAWFNNPTLINVQLDNLLRQQAVWNQVPIISASNMDDSLVYYPDGSIGQGEVVAEDEKYTLRLVDLSL